VQPPRPEWTYSKGFYFESKAGDEVRIFGSRFYNNKQTNKQSGPLGSGPDASRDNAARSRSDNAAGHNNTSRDVDPPSFASHGVVQQWQLPKKEVFRLQEKYQFGIAQRFSLCKYQKSAQT